MIEHRKNIEANSSSLQLKVDIVTENIDNGLGKITTAVIDSIQISTPGTINTNIGTQNHRPGLQVISHLFFPTRATRQIFGVVISLSVNWCLDRPVLHETLSVTIECNYLYRKR